MKKSLWRNQAGATLLEALAFLGIASIVIVGAISMFRSAQGSAHANTMIAELNSLRSSIKVLYATQGYGGAAVLDLTGTLSVAGFGGAHTRNLQNAKALPDSYVQTAGFSFTTSYGATFFFRPYLSQDNADIFILRFAGVSQEVCVKVASQIGGSWMGLQINANPFVSTDTQTFPVATASAQCTSGNSNAMTLMATSNSPTFGQSNSPRQDG